MLLKLNFNTEYFITIIFLGVNLFYIAYAGTTVLSALLAGTIIFLFTKRVLSLHKAKLRRTIYQNFKKEKELLTGRNELTPKAFARLTKNHLDSYNAKIKKNSPIFYVVALPVAYGLANIQLIENTMIKSISLTGFIIIFHLISNKMKDYNKH